MRWFLLTSALLTGHALACEGAAGDSSRIAVAGGSLTEIIYFLGAEDRIVATDRTSNFPPAAMEFPSVGYVRNLSSDGLLSLNPTLILGEHDMGPPEVLTQVSRTGVETVTVPETHTADGILEKIRCVGRVLNLEEHAERLIAARLSPTVDALNVAHAGSTKPRVAVVLGLRDGVPLGAGIDTSGHGLIEMASAINVFADFEGWKPVSLEAMARSDPEFIVVPERGVNDAGGIDDFLQHPAIRLTTAGREKRIIAMDGMTLLGFGPRTLHAALDLAELLHPADPSPQVSHSDGSR